MIKKPFMRAAAFNCRCAIKEIFKEEIYNMATKLKGLDAGSATISGNRAMVELMSREILSTGFLSQDTFICATGSVGGCNFTIKGTESEVNKVIGAIRPYPGSGPVQIGHSYRGVHTGKNAVAVFVSDYFIVSRYDDGSEYGCEASKFSGQFRAAFDERALKSFFEDMNHYRGRVPDSLVEACIHEANKYK